VFSQMSSGQRLDIAHRDHCRRRSSTHLVLPVQPRAAFVSCHSLIRSCRSSPNTSNVTDLSIGNKSF
jgi:hypothetical protein